MSATMQQALASLLVRKTEESRAKARRSIEACQGATTAVQQAEQVSELVLLVRNNLAIACKLLYEPSYFVCLHCIANLNLLYDITQDINKLSSLYTNRLTLQNQCNDIKKRLEQHENLKNSLERSMPNITAQSRHI